MPDVEELAVGAVKHLLAYCPRLNAEIAVNDKTPITDGHIDVYSGPRRNNADLRGRVAVQVKGRTHQNKKIFKKPSTTFSMERSTLTFFRDNGGGVYFYVAVHPESRGHRVFFANLHPFKLNRLLLGMREGQKSVNVTLKPLPTAPAEIERILEFALNTRNQDVNLGFDESVLDGEASFTVYSADGLDLSRPAILELTKTDFAVVVHTKIGLHLPVDVDLSIYPSSYLPQDRDITVKCGTAEYQKITVKQLDDQAVELSLSPTLRLTASNSSLNISLDRGGSVSIGEQISALDFFIAAGNGQEITIGKQSYLPATKTTVEHPGLLEQRTKLVEVAALLRTLQVDPSLIALSDIDDEQMKMLGFMYHAVVLDEQLTADDGRAGRVDLRIGDSVISLMAVPGDSIGRWRFFDTFDPANRAKFRLYQKDEDGEAREIDGTAYEGLGPTELASTLNLRLSEIVGAYNALGKRDAAYALANLKVLDLLRAADAPSVIQRSSLLAAAAELNDWLVSKQGEDPIHLINRWQVAARRGLLEPAQTDEIRSLRRRVLKSEPKNAALLEMCCAILLGDPSDIRHALGLLSDDERHLLQDWPIWTLAENPKPALEP